MQSYFLLKYVALCRKPDIAKTSSRSLSVSLTYFRLFYKITNFTGYCTHFLAAQHSMCQLNALQNQLHQFKVITSFVGNTNACVKLGDPHFMHFILIGIFELVDLNNLYLQLQRQITFLVKLRSIKWLTFICNYMLHTSI